MILIASFKWVGLHCKSGIGGEKKIFVLLAAAQTNYQDWKYPKCLVKKLQIEGNDNMAVQIIKN